MNCFYFHFLLLLLLIQLPISRLYNRRVKTTFFLPSTSLSYVVVGFFFFNFKYKTNGHINICGKQREKSTHIIFVHSIYFATDHNRFFSVSNGQTQFHFLINCRDKFDVCFITNSIFLTWKFHNGIDQERERRWKRVCGKKSRLLNKKIGILDTVRHMIDVSYRPSKVCVCLCMRT